MTFDRKRETLSRYQALPEPAERLSKIDPGQKHRRPACARTDRDALGRSRSAYGSKKCGRNLTSSRSAQRGI